MSIVGDAFAKPILRALDAEPDRWDISSLRVIVSVGRDVVGGDQGRPAPPQRPADPGRLARVVRGHRHGAPARRRPTTRPRRRRSSSAADTRVITETAATSCRARASSGSSRCAGRCPSATTRTRRSRRRRSASIDGVRYSIPGDWATVDADGTVRLLGRGSQCINTGGEKVYPEEVEEVLKLHPTVADAAVVGVPDERFGEAITRARRAARRRRRRRGGADRPRQGRASPPTRRRSGCSPSRRSTAPPTASSTTRRLRGDGATVTRFVARLTKGSAHP